MRKFFLSLALLCSLSAGACLGPFNTFNQVRNWNATVTESKILNELIFLGLNIIPVYGVASFADAIVFNSIEWWGGDNPIPEPDNYGSKHDQGEKDW